METYIIQNHMMRIVRQKTDYRDYLSELFCPSAKQEHRKPIVLLRL